MHSCPRLLPPQTLSVHKQHLQLDAPVSPLGDPCPLRPNFPSICAARGSSEAHPPPSSPRFTPRHLPFLSWLLHDCLPAPWGVCARESPAVGRAGVLPSPQLIPPQGQSHLHKRQLRPSPASFKPSHTSRGLWKMSEFLTSGHKAPGHLVPAHLPQPVLCGRPLAPWPAPSAFVFLAPPTTDPLPWLCPLPGPSLLLHLTQPLLIVPSSALTSPPLKGLLYPQHRERPWPLLLLPPILPTA